MEQEFVFEAALVGERTKLAVTVVCFGEKESVSHFHRNKLGYKASPY